jgi:hypothetical protein
VKVARKGPIRSMSRPRGASRRSACWIRSRIARSYAWSRRREEGGAFFSNAVVGRDALGVTQELGDFGEQAGACSRASLRLDLEQLQPRVGRELGNVLARVLLEPAGEEMVVAELAVGLEAREHDPAPVVGVGNLSEAVNSRRTRASVERLRLL